MITEEIEAQRKIIEQAEASLAIAKSEMAALQKSCKHRWRYSYCAVDNVADCDCLFTFTCGIQCDRCGLESSQRGFFPFCKIHLVEMTSKKILEHLSPQHGQRNRHELKIQYQCKKKGCKQKSVYKLIGGYRE